MRPDIKVEHVYQIPIGLAHYVFRTGSHLHVKHKNTIGAHDAITGFGRTRLLLWTDSFSSTIWVSQHTPINLCVTQQSPKTLFPAHLTTTTITV